MILACQANLWNIYLGLTALSSNRVRKIYRVVRCDGNFFHLDLALLDYLLNEEVPIPVYFSLLETKSIR
jgi:hypothetical protein